MIKTILLDLDGTLLPINMDSFLKRYFKELGIKFSDLFAPDELTKLIWGSTEYMINNLDEGKTNSDAFFEDFYSRIPHKPDRINPIFDDFYINDFSKISEVASRSQTMIDAVNLLKSKGYELVVATNPLFPKRAIVHRIEWAGLNKDDFIFITNFEEMHYCKPHIEFYQEILDKIERKAEECMMVGNDVEEDMVAKKLGVKTYLIENYKIQRGRDLDTIDYHGKYEDFYEFVKALPIVVK